MEKISFKKFVVIDGTRDDLGTNSIIVRISKISMKKLELFPGLITLEGNQEKTAEFQLKSELPDYPLEEMKISMTFEARKLLNVEIGNEIILVDQKIKHIDLLELETIISFHEDVGMNPPICRISEENMAQLSFYENSFVILQFEKAFIRIKVRKGDMNDNQISICREVRNLLKVNLGQKIIIRKETNAEKSDYFFNILKKIDFMQAFKDTEILKLAKSLEKEEYQNGDIICNEGEEGSSMYIIDIGKVEISIKSHLGQKHIIAYLNEGDFFGEISLLTGQNRIATVSSTTYTVLLVINKQSFKNILMIDPTRVEKIAEIVSKRLKETKTYIAESEYDDKQSIEKANNKMTFSEQIRDFFALDVKD
ncbi:MAG: cyclic nucleotide-binding domain-containing protein [bacterium]